MNDGGKHEDRGVVGDALLETGEEDQHGEPEDECVHLELDHEDAVEQADDRTDRKQDQ